MEFRWRRYVVEIRNSQLFIENIEAKNGQLFVRNIQGQTIFEQSFLTNNITINSSAWAKGIYFISISSETTLQTFKIIKL